MVALIIISVGMLGLAKLEVLAYATTSTASQRSIAAIEAASIAAGMHANRGYWTFAPAGLTVSVTGSAVTVTNDATLSTAVGNTPDCTKSTGAVPCSFVKLAAYDLNKWVADLNTALPNPSATINCPAAVSAPVNCTIQISWLENQAGINTQSAGNTMAASLFTLYVTP
jgi:type IV pilus assembly protein PilV